MHLERIRLRDVRCYREADVALTPGVRVFIGGNAPGKTNLLEAVHVLATGSSHRVAALTPLIRAGADAALLAATARSAETGRAVDVELELHREGRNVARVSGQQQPRLRDAIGVVRSVLFAPEDLGLVRGDPSDRRRFLDELLSLRRPAYAAARSEYDRVLRQRNALLKSSRGSGRPHPTLPDWTTLLVRTGAAVLSARIAAVHALTGPTSSAYADLADRDARSWDPAAPDRSPSEGRVGLTYVLSTGRRVDGDPASGVPDPGAVAEELARGAEEVADAERDRGITLVGPHRDELELSIGELPAKGYASHGESWSLALALRLASREVLHEVGDEPVVLLDDVFAELDETRRNRLARRCATFEQVLVTAAVDADVPLDGPRSVVRAGTVAPAAGSPPHLRRREAS